MELQTAKQVLIDAGRWVAEKNMTWGSAGNMSVRVDENTLLITASGTRFDSLDENRRTCYDLRDGSWTGGKPAKELPVHLAVYKQCPWANAVLHASPFYTTLAAASDLEVRSDLFVENMYYLQRMARIPYAHPGSQALSDAVEAVAADSNVILMKNHGVILYDTTMTEACAGLEVLENSCRMCLEMKQAGVAALPVEPDTVVDFLTNSGYRKPRPWQK